VVRPSRQSAPAQIRPKIDKPEVTRSRKGYQRKSVTRQPYLEGEDRTGITLMDIGGCDRRDVSSADSQKKNERPIGPLVFRFE